MKSQLREAIKRIKALNPKKIKVTADEEIIPAQGYCKSVVMKPVS